jgi:secreted PhoX family phosphatase
MACFTHPDNPDWAILVRNHELKHTRANLGAFGPKFELYTDKYANKLYDRLDNGMPLPGGTTTLVYDVKNKKLISHHLSLAGTSTNCAGGATPWESWLTCEEVFTSPSEGVGKYHGYVFEVDSRAKGLVDPVPLTAMGRFEHEACVVDPHSGCVYMTEDVSDSCFYRFIPKTKGRLADGGKLQALMIESMPKALTNNKKGIIMRPNVNWRVRWIDIDDVENPQTITRKQAFDKGAAQFARGEGVALDGNDIFFTCTSGGVKEQGQIFRYSLSAYEGTNKENTQPGHLSLFVEPDDMRVFDYGDNLIVDPRGNLIVCEDRYSNVLRNYLRIITPQAKIATLACSRSGTKTEFAGVCFSPDGSTLFVNLQEDGLTAAITGPWDQFDSRSI